MDSITVSNIIDEINQLYNIEVNPSILFEYETLEEVIEYILEEYGKSVAGYYRDSLTTQ